LAESIKSCTFAVGDDRRRAGTVVRLMITWFEIFS